MTRWQASTSSAARSAVVLAVDSIWEVRGTGPGVSTCCIAGPAADESDMVINAEFVFALA